MKPIMLNYHSRPLTMVRFNRDGDLMYSSAKDSKIFVAKSSTGELVGVFSGHQGAVYAFDVTMDGKLLVSAGADGNVMFWEALTGKLLKTLCHGGICKYVEWNQKPMSQTKIVTCNDRFRGADGEVKDRVCVWHYPTVNSNPESTDPELILTIDQKLPQKATKVGWGPFDETVISIHEEGTVFIWNSMTGEEVKWFQPHRGPITDMQFTDDRHMMLTASKDQTVQLWKLGEKIDVVKLYRTDRPLNTVHISPLAFAKNNKERRSHILCGGGQEAMDVTTSGAASGKFEGVLLHAITEEDMGTIRGHFGPMNYVRFFPDGKGFATGGEDGYVRLHHFDKEYFNPKKWD